MRGAAVATSVAGHIVYRRNETVVFANTRH